MTFVILEIENGSVTGDAHLPANRAGSRAAAGRTFSQYLARHDGMEAPPTWATVCGRRGRVYVDAPIVRRNFDPCWECRGC